jgi:molybdate transport system ATP-binding protein
VSDELRADFVLRYPQGAVIQAELRQPAAGFSVTTLFGPSGCGKTTVLRSLAGLARPQEGIIQIANEVWLDAGRGVYRLPQQRNVGYLFQDYALFPHCTVAENIGFGLRKVTSSERKQRVGELLERFGLADLARCYPHQVSGGQQQRIALARSLARRPRLLLLDEPLSALDAVLREELRSQLRRILAEFDIPVVLVTHDRTEAIAVSDQIVVMEAGKILQSGPVEEVFSRPRDAAVARIVGVETVLSGEIESIAEGLATVRVGGRTLLAVAPAEECRFVHVCIRGEEVTLQRGRHEDLSVRNQLPGTVKWLSPEGALVRVGVDCGFELAALVTRSACEQLQLAVCSDVTAAIKAPSIHLTSRREATR